jgi:mRNA interferase MazF
VTVAPISSTIRNTPAELYLDESDGMKHACAASLQNVVTIDKGAMGKRLCKLGSERMSQLCEALEFALGCDAAEPDAIPRLI